MHQITGNGWRSFALLALVVFILLFGLEIASEAVAVFSVFCCLLGGFCGLGLGLGLGKGSGLLLWLRVRVRVCGHPPRSLCLGSKMLFVYTVFEL